MLNVAKIAAAVACIRLHEAGINPDVLVSDR
jgi:hypothetical protein